MFGVVVGLEWNGIGIGGFNEGDDGGDGVHD
jgi:hypothetical protein